MERGYMTLLTRNGASSYFLGADGETGPEYELVRAFTDFMGVDLKVHVADAFSALSGQLQASQGELIAANLTRTPARELVFRFGPTYNETLVKVVYRRGQAKPRSMQDLAGLRIGVIAGSSYEELLEEASQTIDGLTWEAVQQAGMEDLLLAVAQEDFDVTLVSRSTGPSTPGWHRLLPWISHSRTPGRFSVMTMTAWRSKPSYSWRWRVKMGN